MEKTLVRNLKRLVRIEINSVLFSISSWIDKKLKLEHTKYATSILWEKLQCEICKVSLPKVMNVNGKEIELVKIEIVVFI